MKFSLLFLWFLVHSINGLKFMFYNPRFGLSHVNYVGKLADILADKGGHEIITYQPINNRQFNNTGTKRSKMIVREPDYPLDIDVAQFGSGMWTRKPFLEFLSIIDKRAEFFANACRHQLNDQKLLDQLKAENASLGLTEYFDMCGPLLFHKIGLKFAATYSTPLMQIMTSELGIPAASSFLPGWMTPTSPPFNFKSRVLNVFAETVGMMLFNNKMMAPFEKLAQEHFGPDFKTLCAEANLVFVNMDSFVEYPRPYSDKIVNIGGTGLSKPKPLNDEFQKVMNSSKKGVVLISFGTIKIQIILLFYVAPSYAMPQETKEAFLSAFDHFPDVTFLWKYEKENDFAKKHPNLITSPWLPQSDLLAHPKMLAFLTHGGANSLNEAATIGTPLIVCPLFADQPRNAFLVEFRKLGVRLDAKSLTTENIVNAMREIIDNHSYRQNAKEMAKVIAAKPMNADDTFVKYAELAAQFDLHSKLDIPGRHLSTFVFYNIDVYLFFIVVLTIVILLTFFITRLVVRRIRLRLQKSKTE